jgi:hypothetical protein
MGNVAAQPHMHCVTLESGANSPLESLMNRQSLLLLAAATLSDTPKAIKSITVIDLYQAA